MSQSTKLFVVVGFMFILFTTMNGHLEKYLKIIFGSSSKGIFGTGVNLGDAASFASGVEKALTMFGPI